MNNDEIFSHIDHSLLKAAASWSEIEKLCRESVIYKTASVCLPPSYVKRAALAFPGLNICTAIGFPLGYQTTSAKLKETETALADGAGEIDMVINLGDVKNGDFDRVTKEISAVKNVVDDRVLKVILETCYLTCEEKIALCHCVTQAGADYIKTSTGFGSAGALMEDILLFKEHIGSHLKMKAAGGIRSRKDMVAFLKAGCDRLGTSAAVKILNEEAGVDDSF